MNYLNIHTDTLRSEAYLSSEPVERATWLNLSGWCATQENGGIIIGARDWSDRKWQQLAGVTKEEATLVSELYHINPDGDLVLKFYPIEKEAEVISKRKTAKANGKLGGRPKKTQRKPKDKPKVNPAITNVGLISETQTKTQDESGREGKGMEWNGKRESAGAQTAPPLVGISLAKSNIDSLPVDWGSEHWTAAEERELFENIQVIANATQEDLQVIGSYSKSEGRGVGYLFSSRSNLISNFNEVTKKAKAHTATQHATTHQSGGRTGTVTTADQLDGIAPAEF